MAEVLLFHHAQGLTPGVVAFADDLRAAGHTVHTPDLFDGKTFGSIDEGMSHIDTAEMYGDAELLIADAISGRRDEVFLVSKVLPQNASTDGVIEACERSLSRLRTDRLDCYLLHWRGRIPLRDTIVGFEQLVRSGKILAWGVSNFDVADLDVHIGGDPAAAHEILNHLAALALD